MSRAADPREPPPPPAAPSAELQRDMYRRMVRIRQFDTLVPQLVQTGAIRGTAHSAAGQEAVAVGACFALAPGDYVSSTHRGHGHAIAKGVELRRMMAELYGRETGCCRGKGGSMHIADFSVGMLGANGVVGGGFGIATGAALGSRLRGSDAVVVCFFGDSALNQGAFLENANYAAIHRLPVVYVCENNQFAMSMRAERSTGLDHLEDRARGLGFPGQAVNGMDVFETYEVVLRAVERARRGDGPTLVVATCYRFEGHHVGDAEPYRSRAEVQEWRDRDPLALARERLIVTGLLTEAEAVAIDESEALLIQEAVRFAESSPVPDAAEAFHDIYA